MEDATYIDLIAKYLSGDIEPKEKQELMAWVEASEANKAYFDEMIQLWGISEQYEEEPFEADVASAWNSLNQKLPKEEAVIEKTGNVISLRVWLRVAAAILLLLSVGYWWYGFGEQATGQLVVVQTLEGENEHITLPDSSQIWLNENTTISYNDKFETREVKLDGEAFFQVDRQEDNPFTILSGETTTTVLGTSFNVRAYPDEEAVEVTVETGKVEFKKNSEGTTKAIYLEKGNSGMYDKAAKEVKPVVAEIINADAWKTRTLEFPNQDLSQVITTLERYYGLDINVDDAGILKCNFLMGKEENPTIDLVWDIMEFTMGYEIEKTGADSYKIKGQSCN